MLKFELFRPDGTLEINLASRLTKYLGIVDIGITGGGSLSDARFLQGTPWYMYLGTTRTAFFAGPTGEVSFSGSVMSWSRNDSPARIMYGIYSNGQN